jgi:hypothetical protein
MQGMSFFMSAGVLESKRAEDFPVNYPRLKEGVSDDYAMSQIGPAWFPVEGFEKQKKTSRIKVYLLLISLSLLFLLLTPPGASVPCVPPPLFLEL